MSETRAKRSFLSTLKRVCVIGAIGGAAVGLGATVAYALDPARFPVQRVALEGEFGHVTQAQLMEKVTPHAQGNIFRVDLAALQSDVESLPWIRRVSVRRQWGQSLQLRFEEQQIATRWNGDRWLNTHGEVVDLQGQDPPEGLPQLSGPDGSHERVFATYSRLALTLADPDLRIAQLGLTPRRSWRIQLENGLLLIAGRDDVEEKVARFAQVYARALSKQLTGARQVDLRYTNGFAIQGQTSPVLPAVHREG